MTDAVYQNISQEQVFDKEVSEIISAAMEGYNGTVMCYGQTGAGKTFTMCGNEKSFSTAVLFLELSPVFSRRWTNAQRV